MNYDMQMSSLQFSISTHDDEIAHYINLSAKMAKWDFEMINRLKMILYTGLILWISGSVILLLPFWLPFYLFFTSTTRTLKTIKTIYTFLHSLVFAGPTDPIQYAVLKGNGKYIKGDGNQVFVQQLYDYTSKRFMNLSEIASQTKIVEVECDSVIGLAFLKENQSLEAVSGLCCKQEILKELHKQKSNMSLKQTSYELEEFSNDYDCVLLFNLKEKLKNAKNVDLIKILNYVRHHLAKTGYFVIGQFIEEEGEQKILEELFRIYGFQIKEKECMDKNIQYAYRLKQRKLQYWEEHAIDYAKEKILQLLHRRPFNNSHFKAYILEKSD